MIPGPAEPSIRLTRSEVRTLRACYMGDHIDPKALDAVSVKLDDWLDSLPNGSEAGK